MCMRVFMDAHVCVRVRECNWECEGSPSEEWKSLESQPSYVACELMHFPCACTLTGRVGDCGRSEAFGSIGGRGLLCRRHGQVRVSLTLTRHARSLTLSCIQRPISTHFSFYVL